MDTPQQKVQKQKQLSIFDFNDEFEDDGMSRVTMMQINFSRIGH